MSQPIEVIEAIANCLHGEVFHHVDSVDESSGTLIVFCTDGNPYEVRVRRVTEADVTIDNDGVVPGPITPVSPDAVELLPLPHIDDDRGRGRRAARRARRVRRLQGWYRREGRPARADARDASVRSRRVVQHNTDSQPAVADTSSGTVHVFGWVIYLSGPDADQYVRHNA